MKFSEKLDEIKKALDNQITSETPTATIDEIAKIKASVDELADIHQKQSDEYAQLKDRYIDAVKHYGTGSKPMEETPDGEVSLEKIGAQIILNRGK